jgi:hypothetical protein
VNNKFLVIAYDTNKQPYLYHCNLNGDNCKATNISLGNTLIHDDNGPNFDAVIDTVNNRLILVFTDGITKKLSLIRFGLGGF